MRMMILITLLVSANALSAFAICDETSSYSKKWTSEERHREKRRIVSDSEKNSSTINSSDFSFYPTDTMTCGKGFSDGLGKVSVNGKIGFIDKTGKLAIGAIYRDASRFSEELAAFESNNGKWGFINRFGTVKIKPAFDWALPFKEGLALVQIKEKWGYIDKSGKIVIEPKFDSANSFSEGLAHVQLYLKGELPGYKEPTERYKSGYINKFGTWVIEPEWDGGDDFDGGMALVSRNVGYKNGVVSESLFIDKSGKQLWILDSWYQSRFSENVMTVASGGNQDGYTIIDRSGKILTELVFTYIGVFSEGVASAREDSKYGFIDKTGEFVILPRYDFASGFSEGLAAVEIGQKSGYINKKGTMIISPQFAHAAEFNEELALVAPTGKDEFKTGYIDRKGKYIWKPTR